MKRFLALSLGILLSTLLGVFFSESSVSAQVVYKDFKQATPELLYGPFELGSTICSQHSQTFTIGQSLETDAYYNFLLNEDSNFYYKHSWNYFSNQAGVRDYMDNFVADFQTAIQNPDDWDWGVFQYSMYSTEDSQPTIGFVLGDSSVDFTVDRYSGTNDDIYRLVTNGQYRALSFYQNPSAGCRYQAQKYQLGQHRFGSGSAPGSVVDFGNVQFGYLTFDILNPNNYSVNLPPKELSPKSNLQPNFSYSITKDGKLSWQYLKNISPFLTGVFYTNIDKMNNNWDGLDETIHQVTSNPAGWLDEEWTLPGPGYYQFNISHSQQLDNPPWTNQNFHIQQTFMQFYWDGESEVTGTNIGCSGGELCNPFRGDHSSTWNLFSSLDNINTFGLTSFITAPMTFIGTLPAKVGTCAPVELQWLSSTIELECLRDRYQTWSPTVFAIWQTTVSAVVAFSVAFALFRNIKDMNSPDKDGIEVAKL